MNHPLLTYELTGTPASVLENFKDTVRQKKVPHGILLAGPQGTGKATLAYHMARELLGHDEAVMQRMIAKSHADFLVVEPLFDEKKEEFAREISVEQTRAISEFFSLTAGEGTWRVVIIDGAEAMNQNAANAILKILEEPPPRAVLILVTHHAGRLLPTIRSRCQMIKIPPLGSADFIAVLRQQLPELDMTTIKKLGELSDHSPGIAMALYEQEALDLYEQMELIFEGLPRLDHSRVYGLAEQIASGKQHQNWRLFTRMALHWLASQARSSNDAHWAEQWQQTANDFSLCEARHLDYKSGVISFFHQLANENAVNAHVA